MENRIAEAWDIHPSSITLEDARAEFVRVIAEFDLTPAKLAAEMRIAGDYRTRETIIRSLQRAFAGQASVSAELIVATKLIADKVRRYRREAKYLNWDTTDPTRIITSVRDFDIRLLKWKNYSWQINIVHKTTGYSHPWPAYPKTLEGAKMKAMECLEEAENHIEWMAKSDG